MRFFNARRALVVANVMSAAIALSACDRPIPKESNLEPTNSGSVKTAMPADSQPAFDCSEKLNSAIEELICADKSLAALDRQMAEVWAAAGKTEKAKQDRNFKARQRGWIKGRNDCWRATDKHQCVADGYRQRILELQIYYGLIEPSGSATYLCDGDKVLTSYYATEPPAALARFKGEESLLTIERSGSGSRYIGSNTSIWEHQGEATIVWGPDAPEMRCKVQS